MTTRDLWSRITDMNIEVENCKKALEEAVQRRSVVVREFSEKVGKGVFQGPEGNMYTIRCREEKVENENGEKVKTGKSLYYLVNMGKVHTL